MHFLTCPICRYRKLVTLVEINADACMRCQKDPEAGRRFGAYITEMDKLEKAAR